MLRRELEAEGSIFQTSSDTEVLLHLIKRSTKDSLIESVKEALNKVKGAFAYLLLTGNEMIVALDPNGFRPLSIGKMGDAYVVASETCAFDVVGATYIRDVEPGELLIINDEGIHVDRFTNEVDHAICSMEYIYFARPDSNIAGINVHAARKTWENVWRQKLLLKLMLLLVCQTLVFRQQLVMRRRQVFHMS